MYISKPAWWLHIQSVNENKDKLKINIEFIIQYTILRLLQLSSIALRFYCHSQAETDLCHLIRDKVEVSCRDC